MSEVTINIGRRSYTVSCADGQEEHVRAMGVEVDERLRRLGGNLSANDAKNMLFAAIILADELDEARRKVAQQSRTPSQAEADATELKQAQARLTALEEELIDAREETERLRQHLVNANERLAAIGGATAGSDTDTTLADRLEALAAALENSAECLESAG